MKESVGENFGLNGEEKQPIAIEDEEVANKNSERTVKPEIIVQKIFEVWFVDNNTASFNAFSQVFIKSLPEVSFNTFGSSEKASKELSRRQESGDKLPTVIYQIHDFDVPKEKQGELSDLINELGSDAPILVKNSDKHIATGGDFEKSIKEKINEYLSRSVQNILET
jgi:hypothetical protein